MTPLSSPVFRPIISRSNGGVARGELWLGANTLVKAGLANDLDGHFRMVDRLGQDFLSLSISNHSTVDPSTGYRYFSVAELKEAQAMGHVVLVVVIDGPFQRITREQGLIDTARRWHREKKQFAEAYRQVCARVDDLIRRCLEHSIAAVVVADDLAGENSPFVNPKDIESLFLPFYTRTVAQIHNANATALFHSCGDIRALIPMIESSQFDGLAAIQHRSNDLMAIREKYRSLSIMIAGIDADILEADAIGAAAGEGFRQRIRALCESQGFVLGSSCGLYSGAFLERVQELYRLVDTIG